MALAPPLFVPDGKETDKDEIDHEDEGIETALPGVSGTRVFVPVFVRVEAAFPRVGGICVFIPVFVKFKHFDEF